MSSSATNHASSSSSDLASSSSSDTSTHHIDESPIASIHFGTSQASCEPPAIMHTPSWTPTPIVNGRSRVRCLIGIDENTTDQCDWDQRSTESRHFNSPTGRCMNSGAASHTFFERDSRTIDWKSHCPPSNRLFQDILDIQELCLHPPFGCFESDPTWNRMLIDFAITESNNRSQNVPEEVDQDRRILNDTEDTNNLCSRALAPRPNMDSHLSTSPVA
jgi:hypothetical protein